MRMNSHWKKSRVRVVRTKPVSNTAFQLDVEADGIGENVTSGQFAMINIPSRPDCILPRPFSYFVSKEKHQVSFLIQVVGKGSRALMHVSKGDELALLGPLGNAFPDPKGTCLAVAGGVGIAPFGFWATLPNVEILFGAKDKMSSVLARPFKELGARVSIATEDGSTGVSGTAVDLLNGVLEEQKPETVYACGPFAMMRAVAKQCNQQGLDCWISLEQHMACGFGVCRGCVCEFSSGDFSCICENGPVYNAKTVFGQ